MLILIFQKICWNKSKYEFSLTVLGIDPGLTITGYGIVRREGNKIFCIKHGIIKTKPKEPLAKRIEHIGDSIEEIITENNIDFAVCESLFFGKNVKSIILMAHARGMIFGIISKRNIPVFEFSPREIKRSLTGNGNAAKEQVKYMVCNLLSISDIKYLDETDALAAAISYCYKKDLK